MNGRSIGNILILLGLGAGLIAVPFTLSTFYIQLIYVVFMFVALSASWNILGGYTGYISFGHVVFFGMGGYTTAILASRLGLSPFLTVPAGALIAVLVSLLIGFPTLRLRSSYFVIATLGVGAVFQLLALNLSFLTNGADGIVLRLPPWNVRTVRQVFYGIMLAVATIVVLVNYKIENSKFGLALMSIREDEDAAETMGLNTYRLKLLTLAISAFFTGLTGGIHACAVPFIQPLSTFDPSISVSLVLMCILGGLGSYLGAVLGATLLKLLSELLHYTVASELSMVIYGLLLLIMISFRPDGLVGLLETMGLGVRRSKFEIRSEEIITSRDVP